MLFYTHNKTLLNLKLSFNGFNGFNQVKTLSFLGFHLNLQLTWHTHIKEFTKKKLSCNKTNKISAFKMFSTLYNMLIFHI